MYSLALLEDEIGPKDFYFIYKTQKHENWFNYHQFPYLKHVRDIGYVKDIKIGQSHNQLLPKNDLYTLMFWIFIELDNWDNIRIAFARVIFVLFLKLIFI